MIKISEETKFALLLTSSLSRQSNVQLLKPLHFNALNNALVEEDNTITDLLNPKILDNVTKKLGLDKDQIQILLNRKLELGITLEEWTRVGIWIISILDHQYPENIKLSLKHKSPVIIYGMGHQRLLNKKTVGIVGSRNIDLEDEKIAIRVAQASVKNDYGVVSGGAKGIDSCAMTAAINYGGFALGFLAGNFLKQCFTNHNRKNIADEKLVLMSIYHPNAPFKAWTAMDRNKLIYTYAESSFVIRSSYQTGGTWAGATEELKRKNHKNVYVYLSEKPYEGNLALCNIGGLPFTESQLNSFSAFKQLLTANIEKNDSNIFSSQSSHSSKQLELFQGVAGNM